MNKVRVLLVDDHTMVRRGLRKILESTNVIDIVGEAGDGMAAVEASSSLQPDVVLMDVSLPTMNGIEATRRIRAAAPGTHVLMLSMHADEHYIHKSLAAGAQGYVLKDAADRELVSAIVAVHRGESCFGGTQATATPSAGRCAPEALSPREREVLTGICSGRTNREVADELGLSVNTVETHRKHIVDKLDLHSTAELVRYAIRHGMVGAVRFAR
jgi:DNA-binding NarL/FixJ family response regulator